MKKTKMNDEENKPIMKSFENTTMKDMDRLLNKCSKVIQLPHSFRSKKIKL